MRVLQFKIKSPWVIQGGDLVTQSVNRMSRTRLFRTTRTIPEMKEASEVYVLHSNTWIGVIVFMAKSHYHNPLAIKSKIIQLRAMTG